MKDNRGKGDIMSKIPKKKPNKRQLKEIHDLLDKWYEIGWHVNPKTVKTADVVHLIELIALTAHQAWINRVQRGKAPAEDVSPADGLILIALFVRHLASAAKIRSVRGGLLVKNHYDKEKRAIDKIERKIWSRIDKVAPGAYEREPESN